MRRIIKPQDTLKVHVHKKDGHLIGVFTEEGFENLSHVISTCKSKFSNYEIGYISVENIDRIWYGQYSVTGKKIS